MTEPNREFYVYVYYDPRNFQPFYIGEGKGKRLFSHESDPQDTRKTATIRSIKAAGLEPTIRVIAKGLTKEEARLVEKTLLWSTRGLTNTASGYFKKNFRPKDTLHRTLPDFDFSNQIYYFNVGHGEHRLPFGKPRPSDPTRPVTTLKTAWDTVRRNSKVTGRWHDHRHTLITDLAESGAGEQTIMDIAGHVSRNMLKHYSHIRMEAKRDALESLVTKPSKPRSPVSKSLDIRRIPKATGETTRLPLQSH